MQLKDIIEQQAEEKSRILEIKLVPRAVLTKLQEALPSNLIKVITGPRRAGKSCLALDALRLTNFAYVNFEDDLLLNHLGNSDDLMKALFQVYPNPDYFFFDEIQNLSQWGPFLNKLQRRGHNLIVTGSNAQLLSSELASSLTGRHIPLTVLPLGFKEYLTVQRSLGKQYESMSSAKGHAQHVAEFTRYYIHGGFPECITTTIDSKAYLSTLLDSILLKDIVQRFRLKRPDSLYRMVTYLLHNVGSVLNLSRLASACGIGSQDTVTKYLDHVVASFIFVMLGRFSFKTRATLMEPRKPYIIDPGFAFARGAYLEMREGMMLENAVLIELLRRGFRPNLDLFYYRSKNDFEIDFVIHNGQKISQVIQVCHSLKDQATRTRELRGIFAAHKELHCNNATILTWDEDGIFEYEDMEIKARPVWSWMLDDMH